MKRVLCIICLLLVTNASSYGASVGPKEVTRCLRAEIQKLDTQIAELQKTIFFQRLEIQKLRRLCIKNGIDITPKRRSKKVTRERSHLSMQRWFIISLRFPPLLKAVTGACRPVHRTTPLLLFVRRLMDSKVNFRFEASEDSVTWKVEIPRAIVVEAIESADDPIWFEGDFDVPPAICKRFVELLNVMNKE